jgi:hypothetical protein
MIPARKMDRTKTEKQINRIEKKASAWIKSQSAFYKSGATLDFSKRQGPPMAASDMLRFMESCDLKEMEVRTATNFVSNPESGEWVKGMKIILAEMGLCPFRGKAIRTDDIFKGRGTRARRRRYLIHWFAFLRALYRSVGIERVSVFRGASMEGDWKPKEARTFTSWSFNRAVAESFCKKGLKGEFPHGYLIRRTFPIEKLLMTYIETAAMNDKFKEAEALVLTSVKDQKIW